MKSRTLSLSLRVALYRRAVACAWLSACYQQNRHLQLTLDVKWFTEFGHLNRGDMLTSEQHRCHNEKKKFQRRV